MDSILEDPQQHHWTAPWRDDLPTPPSDIMNGVAYNTFLPSASTTTNPSSYGRKHNELSLHPYSKFPSQSLSSFGSTSLSSSSKHQIHNYCSSVICQGRSACRIRQTDGLPQGSTHRSPKCPLAKPYHVIPLMTRPLTTTTGGSVGPFRSPFMPADALGSSWP